MNFQCLKSLREHNLFTPDHSHSNTDWPLTGRSGPRLRWKMLPACPVFQWPIAHNSDLRDSLEYKLERESERPSYGPEHDNKWGKYQARQSNFIRYDSAHHTHLAAICIHSDVAQI